MLKYFVRHAEASRPKGEVERVITPRGIVSAKRMGIFLRSRNFCPEEPVAVGASRIMYETAVSADFEVHHVYDDLAEVRHRTGYQILRRNLAKGVLPSQALERAEAILDSRMNEKIVITDGLVIAALRQIKQMEQGNLMPRYSEVTVINL